MRSRGSRPEVPLHPGLQLLRTQQQQCSAPAASRGPVLRALLMRRALSRGDTHSGGAPPQLHQQRLPPIALLLMCCLRSCGRLARPRTCDRQAVPTVPRRARQGARLLSRACRTVCLPRGACRAARPAMHVPQAAHPIRAPRRWVCPRQRRRHVAARGTRSRSRGRLVPPALTLRRPMCRRQRRQPERPPGWRTETGSTRSTP